MNRLAVACVALLLAAPSPASAYVGYDDAADPLYGWSDTLNPTDAHAPTYGYTSISASGTALSYSSGVATSVPIGFTFEYFEATYTTVNVSAYGLVGFDSVSSGYPTLIPSSGNPNNFIAGAWLYWETYSPSGWYETRGSAPNREFVVQQRGSYYDYDYITVDYQVVLREDGDIFVYVEEMPSLYYDSLSIGLENADASRSIVAFYGSGPLDSYAAVFQSMGERPRVTVTTLELSVAEGSTLELEIDVTDRQEDLDTVTWDLDLDGEFDDGDGTTITISAEGLDGPDTIEVEVRAADLAGNERIYPISIEVTNAPPQILNEPVTEVLRGEEWEFMAEIFDPGGDDVALTAPTRPDGMTVLGTGGVRWRPTDEDVGDHEILLLLTDDDDDDEVEGDGELVYEFTLTVLENTAPGQPGIIAPRMNETLDTLRPTFQVTTPDDPEGDSLFLTFDIDTVDTFSSASLVSSGRISATLGETGWTADQDLEDGESYWWRVYAWDGHDQGPAARGRFTIDLGGGEDGGPDAGPEPEDGGPDTDVTPPGACECVAGGGSPTAAIPIAALAMLFFLARRRIR